MCARETAELLLQVGRLVQADGYDGELSPAQWMALRFFAGSRLKLRECRWVPGERVGAGNTATQTIKLLEARGYLVRESSKADRRSICLRLTSKGKKALARDPFEILVRAVDLLDAKERTAMRRALHQVLSTVAHRQIGVCQDCTHYGREIRRNPPSTAQSAAECLLLAVPIQPEDVGLLCVHFQPTNEHRDDAYGE
jgi:DNA-binding MarR family transcriptional regulator